MPVTVCKTYWNTLYCNKNFRTRVWYEKICTVVNGVRSYQYNQINKQSYNLDGSVKYNYYKDGFAVDAY